MAIRRDSLDNGARMSTINAVFHGRDADSVICMTSDVSNEYHT